MMKAAVDLDLERECRNCVYRKTGWICTNAKSDSAQQKVGSEDTCQYFEPSRAQAHFIRALSDTMFFLHSKTASEKQSYTQAILSNYSQAITLGLPKEDEVAAQCGIATTYAHGISERVVFSREDSALVSPEMQKLLTAFKEACEEEKKHHIEYIAGAWYLLSKLDMLFEFNASVIAKESQQAAEEFTRKQLAAVEHVEPTPLPRMTLRLGKALGRKGQYDAAVECFDDVVESLSRKEASFVTGGEKVRLEAISLRDKSVSFSRESSDSSNGNPPTPTKKAMCFIATAVYGSEIAPEVLALRQFRDNVLLPSRIGQRFVGFYYYVSPPLARLIAKNEFLKDLVRWALIAPMLRLIEKPFDLWQDGFPVGLLEQKPAELIQNDALRNKS